MFRKFWIFLYKTNSRFLVKRSMKFRTWRPIRAYRRRLYNYVISHYKSNYVIIDGRKMHLDPNDSLRLSLKEYAPFHKKLTYKEIKKGDTVIDLGANIGFWTLYFAQKVGEDGKVFAFEPEPTNLELLQKNVKENDFKNIVIEQKAVSHSNDKLKLFLSYETTDHRIYDPGDNRNFIEIESIRLDDYFKSDEEIDFIKSNIQGADFSAIKGMPNLIQRSKKLKIMIEFYPELLRKFNADPGEFLTTLQDFGFKLYDIDGIKNEVILMTKDDLLLKYDNGNLGGTMLFCSREKLSR